MGGGVVLTATAAALIRPTKLPESSVSTTTPAATNFRTSSSNHAPLSSSFHFPYNDTCDNRQDSSVDCLSLSAPSRTEVQAAIASLQSFMQGISQCGTELSWLRHILSMYDPLTQSPGFRRLKDAVYLLETNQSIQRLVLSISTDKSVWDAVLNNKLVKELQESRRIDEFRGSPGNKEEPDAITSIKRWILDMVKEMIMELVEKFKSLVDEIFESTPRKENMSAESRKSLEEKLKSSVLLSIVILLIVVVTRTTHVQ